jgi:pyruvate formate lyase activating enzyme
VSIRLAGLQKNSFIDYPAKICGVLFVTGCNFHCPYCHNPALARGEYPDRIASVDALAYLKSRRGLLEGVTITGGEPTLAAGLIDLCRSVKGLGFPLKLDTNGSRPDLLGQLIDQGLVDFVAMDIKAPLDAYGPFCGDPHLHELLAASIRLIMDRAPAYEFRTTCAAPLIDQAAVTAIAAVIEGAQSFVLQTFNRRAACLDPEFGRRQDPTITAETMQRFKRVAEPFVKRCTIR